MSLLLTSFLRFLSNRHTNIISTIEKQINHSIALIDVFILGINNQNLTIQTYHKSTYTGFLLNFKGFTSFSCKINLSKFLIDRPFKICNNWNSFHNNIENIKSNQTLAWRPYCHLHKSRKRGFAGRWKAHPNIKPTQNSQWLVQNLL